MDGAGAGVELSGASPPCKMELSEAGQVEDQREQGLFWGEILNFTRMNLQLVVFFHLVLYF